MDKIGGVTKYYPDNIAIANKRVWDLCRQIGKWNRTESLRHVLSIYFESWKGKSINKIYSPFNQKDIDM